MRGDVDEGDALPSACLLAQAQPQDVAPYDLGKVMTAICA